jgi:Thiamine pyrophosphate enzyme, N-terminal TPP binding domain
MVAMVPNIKPNYVAPTPLSAAHMIEALRAARVSHLIVVPDTYQKTFLSAVDAASDLKMVSACTEDEAVGINAGLYATGHRPMLSVQNNGIYACMNTCAELRSMGPCRPSCLSANTAKPPMCLPKTVPSAWCGC